MSSPLSNNLNFNQNQAENLVLQNLLGAPSTPVPGQIYYDTTGAKQRAYYYSPTGNAGAPGWILIDNPTVDVDNYVDSVAFSTSTGILTLGRTGALADLTANLDGRYITGNQSITLSGHISGSGTTSISTTLQPTAISSQPDATVGTNGNLTGVSNFLVNQGGTLVKYSWTELDEYINYVATSVGGVTNFTTSVSATNNPTVTQTITTTNGTFPTTFNVLGTASEVTVQGSGSNITIGLPDDVSITNNLVVGGNLTVQGTTTTLNTTELLVEDNLITLNSGVTGTPTANAGVEIERGTSTNTSVLWNESSDRWTFTNDGTTFYNIPIPSEYTAYVHPTQAAINVDGSGLQFVQDVTVNTLGHVTAVSLGTIPDASTTTKGVVRLTATGETTGTTLATTPDIVASMISAAIAANTAASVYKTTITPTANSTSPITHNLGTTDVTVEVFNTANGQTVIADVFRANNNLVNIVFGNLGSITSLRVIVSKK